MKKTIAISMLFAFQMSGPLASANTHACKNGAEVVERAEDEVCDHLVDASEDCFAKLNERFALLSGRPAGTAPKAVLSEAEPLKKNYESAIATVGAYLTLREMDQKNCGDQRARVKVMIEELNSDLRDISARIQKAKAK